MSRGLSLVIILTLIFSGTAPLHADEPFTQHMNSTLSEPTTAAATLSQVTQQLNYEALANNDELMGAFADALLSGDNLGKANALARQFEQNEATYIRLLEALLEKAKSNPQVLNMAMRNASRLEEYSRNLESPGFDLIGQVYEMSIFSVSYLALVYSLKGVSPETTFGATDLVSNSGALTTLMLLASLHQTVNFSHSIRAYFKTRREHRNSIGFFRNFASWLKDVETTTDLKELTLLMKIHRYVMLTPDRFQRSNQFMQRFSDELLKLNQTGLLGKFQTFLAQKNFKDRGRKMLSLLSPDEWKTLREAAPDDVKLLMVQNRALAMTHYHSAHREVIRWLAASGDNTTAQLRTVVQQRLDQTSAAVARDSRPSLFRKISTQALTIGGLIIGMGLAVNSGVIPALDAMLPADFLNYVRDPVRHGNLDLAVMFFPAFALVLYEFDFIKSRFPKRNRSRDRQQAIKNLESTLDLLSVLERQHPDQESRMAYIQQYNLLLNTSDSANDVIERIETARYPLLAQALTQTTDCEDLLKAK